MKIAPEHRSQVQIAFATHQQLSMTDPIDFGLVEIFMTVNTSIKLPFVTHYGICRRSEAVKRFQKHSNLSLSLHAFSGQRMHVLYPEKEVLYVPALKIMKKIMKRAFPEELASAEASYKINLHPPSHSMDRSKRFFSYTKIKDGYTDTLLEDELPRSFYPINGLEDFYIRLHDLANYWSKLMEAAEL